MKKLTIMFAFVAILATTVFVACKKTASDTKLIEENGLGKAKALIEERIKNNGGLVTRIRKNQRLKIAYNDMAGNIFKSPVLSDNITSLCAGSDPNYADISYYGFSFNCINDSYGLKFAYTISWDNNIVAANPFNLSNITTGRVIIKDGPTVLYEKKDCSSTITDMGADPNNPGSEIFLVEFTTGQPSIPKSVFSTPGFTLRVAGKFATDCSSLANWPMAPMDPNGLGDLYYGELAYGSCNKNDMCFFLGSQVVPNAITIFGYDPLGKCTGPLASRNDYSEVEYFIDGISTKWEQFANKTNPFKINGYSFLSAVDFGTNLNPISNGTYDIKIRYRNIILNDKNQFGQVPLNSLLNSGQGAATAPCCVNPNFEYEFWPQVVIQ